MTVFDVLLAGGWQLAAGRGAKKWPKVGMWGCFIGVRGDSDAQRREEAEELGWLGWRQREEKGGGTLTRA